MTTHFEIIAKSGKRVYELWLDVENYYNSFEIGKNQIIIEGEPMIINPFTHKDWQKAFIVNSDVEGKIKINFKKDHELIKVSRISKWRRGEPLFILKGIV